MREPVRRWPLQRLLLPVLRQDEREDPRRKHGGRYQWQVETLRALKGAAGHTVRLNLSVLQQQYPHLFEVPPCASLFNSLGYWHHYKLFHLSAMLFSVLITPSSAIYMQ